jgi:uncharacterized protein
VFVVDTNLLVYAADEDFARQTEMRRLLEAWSSSSETCYVTWSIVYEFLAVSTQRSAFAHPLSFLQAWRFIDALRGYPSFRILLETDRHPEVVRDLVKEYPHMSGTKFHDLHIAAIMREHGITDIRTADTDFHQFKFLRVTNPLVA